MSDTLELFGKEYAQVVGFKVKNDSGATLTYVRPQGKLTVNQNGSDIDVSQYASLDVNVSGGGYTADEIVSTTGISGVITITVASVRQYALAYCNGITEIVAPNLTSFSTYCFSYMTGLTRASFPVLTRATTKFMINNTNLVSVSFPALTTIAGDQFIENSKLEHLVLPSFTGTIYNNSLKTNKNLLSVDVGAATSIGATAFNNCSVLSGLIIRGNSLTALNNVSAFQNTPFASGGTGGTLFVPQALIADYQAATNWSTILGYENNQILPIEGSIYETQYADGIPIESE